VTTDATHIRELATYYAPYSWFLVVWTAPLVALCTGTFVSNRVLRDNRSGAFDATRPGPPARFAGRSSIIAPAALAAFACLYAFLVLYHEDLVGLDYAQLTAPRFVSVQIWPDNGRFFPFGLQEYNLLGFIGTSARIYRAFSVLELAVVLFCVYRILASTPPWFRCGVILVLMTSPSFVDSFFSVVIQERDMLVLLCVWLLCYLSFIRHERWPAFCGALIAAQFLLYEKETSFVLIGGFACARILLRAWVPAPPNHLTKGRRFLDDNLLEIGQIVLCGVFLLVYSLVVARHVKASYVQPSSWRATVAAFEGYAHSDLLVDALALAFAARVVLLLLRKCRADAFWDSIAAAALVFAAAYVKLGIVRSYYLAPADCVAVLYLAWMGHAALHDKGRRAIAGVVIATALVVQRNIRDAASSMLDRKQFVEANVHLAAFLKTYAQSHEPSVTLYIPDAGGFQIMEFSAFLRLKGLQADGMPIRPQGGQVGFAVKTPHRYPGDVCHPSQRFRCAYEAAPHPGDLIVFLPGGDAPVRALPTLEAAGTEAYHYRPAPTALERLLGAIGSGDAAASQPSDAYVFTTAR
jgi:hypothetical protein